MLDINKTYHVNCIAGMQQLDDECVDLVVTSPPYDDLRTYNDTSKWDMTMFYGVAAQLTRVLKPGGYLLITEHSASNDYDRMLIDIQHAFFELVYRNTDKYKYYSNN